LLKSSTITNKEYVDLEDQAADETTQNGPVGTGGSEFNLAIILNIWSVIALPSLSFDTMDPSESWGINFCRFMFRDLLRKP
jgi:hypothetical protein